MQKKIIFHLIIMIIICMPLSGMMEKPNEMENPNEKSPLTVIMTTQEHDSNTCCEEDCCRKVEDWSWLEDRDYSCLGITKCLGFCCLAIIHGCCQHPSRLGGG